MKAPDKICVAPHQIFDYDLDIQEVGHNGAEEYIRKDALLEWVKEELASYAEEIYSTDHYEDGCKDVLRQIIDKLNEM